MTESTSLKTTPLTGFHKKHNAKMVDFFGWEMPILYTGINEEHAQTRNSGSLFDISHMGRINVRGDDALKMLQNVCTRQLGNADVGQSRYTHVCNEKGGILDDVIVSRYEDHWLVVCNASNRPKILQWLQKHATGDCDISDQTESTLMVALQGPAVMDKLKEKLPFDIDGLKRYRFRTGNYMFVNYTIFRSGYTGEDGVEVILPASIGSMAGSLLTGGDDNGASTIKPAGLGARDTLRLEAGMPLYGHELTEETDTISAGLSWCVDLDKGFIGADALRKVAESGPKRKLVGLELDGKRIARQHAVVQVQDKPVGEVTSGTFSPTLNKSIAMAYVESEHAENGTTLQVKPGNRPIDAVVVPLPFYKRS